MKGDPRIWKVVFTDANGKKRESRPLTRDQAQQRMRSTQWMPNAQPRIVRG